MTNILSVFKLPKTGTDDLSQTIENGKLIKEKYSLRKTYESFYHQFEKAISDIPLPRRIVELGSGSGFLKDMIPDVITSEILEVPNVDLHFSASAMPFADHSVDAFLLLNVLHHIPNPKKFFEEANRCLKPHGKIVLIDHANTPWGRFIFKSFQHENFDLTAQWEFGSTGPLSSASGALAWIMFFRDRLKFEKFFPALKIIRTKAHTPFRYLLSGGMSYREFIPPFFYPVVVFIENILFMFNPFLGLFMTVEIRKQG